MSTARDYRAAQGVQRRSVVAELRTAGDEFAIIGYAATFNSLSKNLGGFKEQIQPGAFARSIRQRADVRCLFNHDSDQILGRTKSGTLQLKEDSTGLWFRCNLNPESQAHKDLYASIKRGDIDQCSFGFTVTPAGQRWQDGGAVDDTTGQRLDLRTLTDVDLLDVSPVTFPAYNETSLSARTVRSMPDYQWKTGYSRKTTVTDSFAVDMMRKATRAMAPPQRRGNPGLNQEAFDLIGAHLQRCHEALEDAYATGETINDIFGSDGWDDSWDAGWDDDDRSLKRSLTMVRAHIDLAAQKLAKMRLHHSKLADALGRKG